MAKKVTFKNAPVVETVLGIQFERLRGLTNAHLGAFWQEIRADWPLANDAQKLKDEFELFVGPQPWSQVELNITQDPSARLQIRNELRNRMIQVQDTRFHYNWLGGAGGPYPRYKEVVRPEFDALLERFKTFLGANDLGQLVPNQWEVTYVNHIAKDSVWESPEEWATIFAGLPGPTAVVPGLSLTGFGGNWHFEIEPQRARLHVEVQHGRVGAPDGLEAIVMKLTARGPVDKVDEGVKVDEAINRGLNLGHEVIVTSFRDLTSQKAHEYWRIEP